MSFPRKRESRKVLISTNLTNTLTGGRAMQFNKTNLPLGRESLLDTNKTNLFILALGLFPVLIVNGVHAATIYVDASATGGTYNGDSWATAHQHLQDALAEPPQADDQIWVAKG